MCVKFWTRGLVSIEFASKPSSYLEDVLIHIDATSLKCPFQRVPRTRMPRMLSSGKLEAQLLTAFALVFSVLLFVSGAPLAAERDPVDQPLYDIVAVGRGPGQILLATLASPSRKLQWRFRKIPLLPKDKAVADVSLSSGGTKALIIFADGTSRVFDLTKPLTGIAHSDVPTPQHRLPHQLFHNAANGEVCLLDDLGNPTDKACRKAKAAAIHEDGRVLYEHEDGSLVIVSPGTGAQEELPYRLPRGADFQLLAGHRGDVQDFLVLVTESGADQSRTKRSRVTKIINPRMPAIPIGEFADFTIAALRAEFEFPRPLPGPRKPPAPICKATRP